MALTLRATTVSGATTVSRALTHEEMDANLIPIINIVTPESYGAVGDGSTDDSTAWTNALAAIVNGGTLFLRPGANYLFSSQVTVSGPANDRICIYGYGAEVSGSGAISGLKITGGGNTGGVSVFGLKVNHRGNSSATYGFDILESHNARLYDCFVEAHGVGASYAAYHLGNSTPATDSTGSFWTQFRGCGAGKRSGSDVGAIPIGILLEGAANATTIDGGSFSCTTGIKFDKHTGQTTIPNSVLVHGVWFEGYTTAILVTGATTSNIAGLRFVGNRFENGTTVFSFTTITTQPSQAPFAAFNHFASNAGTYISNTNSLHFNSLDMALTPAIGGSLGAGACSFIQDLEINATSGSTFPLTVRPGGGSRGIRITSGYVSTAALDMLWTGTSNKARITATTGSVANLAINGVQGISGSTANTDRTNLRGSATFVSAATVSVTFATAEPNTTYFVAISGSANETFWVTSKGTGGFTLNSSNATSTATVDWVLIG